MCPGLPRGRSSSIASRRLSLACIGLGRQASPEARRKARTRSSFRAAMSTTRIRATSSSTPATVERIVRATAVSQRVKELHGYQCQICGERLNTIAGPYAEGAHIRPLGRPHDGPDTIDNVLCLCANHHVLFDGLALHVAADLR